MVRMVRMVRGTAPHSTQVLCVLWMRTRPRSRRSRARSAGFDFDFDVRGQLGAAGQLAIGNQANFVFLGCGLLCAGCGVAVVWSYSFAFALCMCIVHCALAVWYILLLPLPYSAYAYVIRELRVRELKYLVMRNLTLNQGCLMQQQKPGEL
jgi:hypothetical protein